MKPTDELAKEPQMTTPPHDGVPAVVSDGLLDRLGLGGDLVEPTRSLLRAVAADQAAIARTAELTDGIRARIGHFFGQETLFSETDLSGFNPTGEVEGEGATAVEGAVPLAALILTAPDVETYWREIGYPHEVIAATVVDLGRQVRKTIAVTGRFGLGQAGWLEMIWRGGFAQLGRLQFEIARSNLGREDVGEGPLVLSTHIAPVGPLAPDAVDASLGRARGFFRHHFGDLAGEPGAFDLAGEPGAFNTAVCHSWLLDDELMRRMPGSNMDSFARRWTVWDRPVSDGSGMFFGFDRPYKDGERIPEVLDDLPYDSRLHRTMIDLWRSGAHICNCSGWLTLPT